MLLRSQAGTLHPQFISRFFYVFTWLQARCAWHCRTGNIVWLRLPFLFWMLIGWSSVLWWSENNHQTVFSLASAFTWNKSSVFVGISLTSHNLALTVTYMNVYNQRELIISAPMKWYAFFIARLRDSRLWDQGSLIHFHDFECLII